MRRPLTVVGWSVLSCYLLFALVGSFLASKALLSSLLQLVQFFPLLYSGKPLNRIEKIAAKSAFPGERTVENVYAIARLSDADPI